jgi:hypothetical protein
LWSDGIGIQSTKAWCWSLAPTAKWVYFHVHYKRVRRGSVAPGKYSRKHCERVSMQLLESTVFA